MRVTVYIPESLAHEIKGAARDEGLSLSALTAKALEQYLKRKRKRAAGHRLLELVRPGSVTPEAWNELEKGRVHDRA